MIGGASGSRFPATSIRPPTRQHLSPIRAPISLSCALARGDGPVSDPRGTVFGGWGQIDLTSVPQFSPIFIGRGTRGTGGTVFS
jgi:hypothetical protein